MRNSNNSKNVNGSLIKESLLDYNNLANQLKESTPGLVKDLLAEQVKEAYAAILNESDDDEVEDNGYNEEEVEDTNSDDIEDVETPVDDEDDSEENADEEGMEPTDVDGEETESEDEVDEPEAEDEGDDELSQDLNAYKTSEDEYDLRTANDNDVVKIYKLMKNDDTIKVVKDDDKIQISDAETGAEYLIDLDGDNTSDDIDDDNIITDNMNESIIYEIALNEYDSHVGVTDKYQSEDVLTNDGVSEPSKYGRDIDKGVPQNTQKPWAKPNKKAAPFNGEVKECGVMNDNASEMDESTIGARHGHSYNGLNKVHITNNPDGCDDQTKVASVGGQYVGKPKKSKTELNVESIEKKANKIFETNKKLQSTLSEFQKKLEEAAVVNVNLGGIIKLISENSTTKAEKKDIINRFTNEAHTITESQNLYQRIANELKKKPSANASINEEKQYGNAQVETINESKFYQDESLMDSLGLMHKICK